MDTIPLTFKIYRDDQLIREEILREIVVKIGKVPSAHLKLIRSGGSNSLGCKKRRRGARWIVRVPHEEHTSG